LKFGGIIELHFAQVVPIAVPAFVVSGGDALPLPDFGGCTDPRFGRGSRATGCPQRAHCGTPIGVNALHASQTNPTSISLEYYPLAKWCVKERGL
jgi:hypothetical protein